MIKRNKFVSFLKEQIHHCFSYVYSLDKIKMGNHPQTEFIISIEANSTLFVKIKCKICNFLCTYIKIVHLYLWLETFWQPDTSKVDNFLHWPNLVSEAPLTSWPNTSVSKPWSDTWVQNDTSRLVRFDMYSPKMET